MHFFTKNLNFTLPPEGSLQGQAGDKPGTSRGRRHGVGADLSVRAHAHSPSWDHLGRHTHMRTHMCKCHFVGAPTCAPTWAHVLPFFALGLKTNENLAKTITNATLGPHAPEVGSKMRQVGPKMLQDRPKMAPRSLQMAPRLLQEPKMSPRCPKIAPRRPNFIPKDGR